MTTPLTSSERGRLGAGAHFFNELAVIGEEMSEEDRAVYLLAS